MGNCLVVRKGDTSLAQVENYDEVAYRTKVSSEMMNCITNSSGTPATVLNYPTITGNCFKMVNQTFTFLKAGQYRRMIFNNSMEKMSDEIFTATANQTYTINDSSNSVSMCVIYHIV